MEFIGIFHFVFLLTKIDTHFKMPSLQLVHYTDISEVDISKAIVLLDGVGVNGGSSSTSGGAPHLSKFTHIQIIVCLSQLAILQSSLSVLNQSFHIFIQAADKDTLDSVNEKVGTGSDTESAAPTTHFRMPSLQSVHYTVRL